VFFADIKLTLLAAAIAAVIYLLFFCRQGESATKSLVKTISVALLALAGVLAGSNSLLVLGLLFSAVGDFLLSRDDESAFSAGVGAFVLAHACYVVLFVTSPMADVSGLTSGRILLAAGLLVYGAFMLRRLYLNTGDLRVSVMIYVPAVIAMALSSLTLPQGYEVVVLAAFLFVLSDSILAADMFLLRDSATVRRITPYIAWLTYWLAQFGILLGYPVWVG